jgi:hypothetical protein
MIDLHIDDLRHRFLILASPFSVVRIDRAKSISIFVAVYKGINHSEMVTVSIHVIQPVGESARFRRSLQKAHVAVLHESRIVNRQGRLD